MSCADLQDGFIRIPHVWRGPESLNHKSLCFKDVPDHVIYGERYWLWCYNTKQQYKFTAQEDLYLGQPKQSNEEKGPE